MSPTVNADELGQMVNILYTDHMGKTFTKCVIPIQIVFASSQVYVKEQWLLECKDPSTGEIVAVAICGIHRWSPAKVWSTNT